MSGQINFQKSLSDLKLLTETKEKPYIEFTNGSKLSLHKLRQSGLTSMTTEYLKWVVNDCKNKCNIESSKNKENSTLKSGDSSFGAE